MCVYVCVCVFCSTVPAFSACVCMQLCVCVFLFCSFVPALSECVCVRLCVRLSLLFHRASFERVCLCATVCLCVSVSLFCSIVPAHSACVCVCVSLFLCFFSPSSPVLPRPLIHTVCAHAHHSSGAV